MQTKPEIDQSELMARLGIVEVPAHQYRYRGWRYTNLKDALAQAKRDVMPATAT